MQYWRFRVIREVHIPEPDLALDLSELACIRGVDDLRLDIQNLEDALARRHGALQRFVAHGEFLNRGKEALDQQGKGGDEAHRNATGPVDHQTPAEPQDEAGGDGGE